MDRGSPANRDREKGYFNMDIQQKIESGSPYVLRTRKSIYILWLLGIAWVWWDSLNNFRGDLVKGVIFALICSILPFIVLFLFWRQRIELYQDHLIYYPVLDANDIFNFQPKKVPYKEISESSFNEEPVSIFANNPNKGYYLTLKDHKGKTLAGIRRSVEDLPDFYLWIRTKTPTAHPDDMPLAYTDFVYGRYSQHRLLGIMMKLLTKW